MATTANNNSSGRVTLDDGTTLPFETRPSPLNIIVGHGLGTNPADKSHLNDISNDLWTDAVRSLVPAPSVGSDEPHSGCTAVLYTARGHGDSRGWDKGAVLAVAKGSRQANTHDGGKEVEGGLDVPFRWPNLAEDMLSVANSCGLREGKFAAFGQSMGAASALYMTILHPERVGGLILARPPRAWEGRRRAKPDFVRSAEEMKSRGDATYLPILGAANTDLPSRDEREAYGRVKCPVLILSHGQDDAHPIETGRMLAELIPQARLEVATNEAVARRVWPAIIADWLLQEGLAEKEG